MSDNNLQKHLSAALEAQAKEGSGFNCVIATDPVTGDVCGLSYCTWGGNQEKLNNLAKALQGTPNAQISQHRIIPTHEGN